MWKGRFKMEPKLQMLRFTQSLDLDWRLYEYDIKGSMAHARMLEKVGLINAEEKEAILQALQEIRIEIARGELPPSIELEDVHMNIEQRLIEKLGDAGAKIHTGRSRNDQIALDMHLFMKDHLSNMKKEMLRLLDALLDLAARDIDIIIPGYTHLQIAQPLSMGHYWMCYFWNFIRDYERLEHALKSSDVCPLGAGALAGSTLPLDREFVRQELGFARLTENSIDSISERDYMLDYHFFASTFIMHCSRLAEDMIIYASQEFGYIELPDEFCTGSSMMPQKKNPDVFELIRGRSGQIFGHLLDLLVTLKGLPLSYNRDMQEDKRGLFSSLMAVQAILDVFPGLLAAVTPKQNRVDNVLKDGFILATDVAEYLTIKGVPFRKAHAIVGKAVKQCIEQKKSFFNLTIEEWKSFSQYFDDDIKDKLSLRESVDRRKTFGGASRDEVARQIDIGRNFVKHGKK